ncbi:MAG: MarR family transcriptional regulator [Candidatus Taylorbacteria bacterium]|nr:MarR family transcriptional regulator [Candidatus Taylorbacteria bacterium]
MSDIKKSILNYINNKKTAKVKDLVDNFNVSKQAMHKHLNELIELGMIEKVGSAPKVFYIPRKIEKAPIQNDISDEKKKILSENYMIITPEGRRLEGIDGFEYWCSRHDLPLEKTVDDYISTFQKYDKYKIDGLIDATPKISESFEKIGLDKMYYKDLYSIERFGKTKLGQILLYAKQSQDKNLIKQISDIIRDSVLGIVNRENIDAVGFIPPTVKREVQLMKELRKMLSLSIPEINLIKVRGDVSVPQKTLNRIEDRIENARKSIFIDSDKEYNNILLIDDAVGSGATLNETALQIKERSMCKGKIIGFAITGSFKGFDVISEV